MAQATKTQKQTSATSSKKGTSKAAPAKKAAKGSSKAPATKKAAPAKKAAAAETETKGPGKIQQILDLHKSGLSNQEIVEKGFNKTTVSIQVSKYKRENGKGKK